MSEQKSDLLDFTARIVAAHLGNNQVDASAVPSVIRSVYSALAGTKVSEPEPVTALRPAVPAKKSVFPDFIICLEDGVKLKLLKRHLYTSYGMTPKAYRAKWGLPPDYPMVAPNYASTRSTLAKQISLGKKMSAATVEPEADHLEATHVPFVKAGRARRFKK